MQGQPQLCKPANTANGLNRLLKDSTQRHCVVQRHVSAGWRILDAGFDCATAVPKVDHQTEKTLHAQSFFVFTCYPS
jgi:hypothetical protein